MEDGNSNTGTFGRSCQHWSEEGRTGMEAFYQLASLDYQLLAQEIDWLRLFQHLAQQHGPNLSLLDVACGSGKFPAALLRSEEFKQTELFSVAYSLLDPSEFSIRTARKELAGPFKPSTEHPCTVQALPPTNPLQTIVWAIHALYCVPQAELPLAIDRIRQTQDSSGLGFIAHASQESHYIQFHDLYLKSRLSSDAEPYSTAEQIIEVLETKLPPSELKFWSIDYEGQLDLADQKTAEGYLQRCIFDDNVSMEQMLADEHMGPHLRSCMDTSAGLWRFRQKVWLIFFGRPSTSIADFK